jgi:hypothetical protein
MGAGCAREAAERFPELPRELGFLLREFGTNVFRFPTYHLITFPTKRHWSQRSDLDLIRRSAFSLAWMQAEFGLGPVVLPRPGCGLGGLSWPTVRKVIEEFFRSDDIIIISPAT